MLDLQKNLFEENRVSTGIDELDIVLMGGYKLGSTVSLIGGVDKEKFLFAYYFLTFKPSICIAVDMSPSDIIEKAGEIGVDLNHVEFIDAYSKPTGVKPRDKDVVVSSPSSLTDISISLTKLLGKKQNPRVAVLSYSTLHTSTKSDSAFSFLKVIEGKVKSNNGILMLTIDQYSHKKAELEKIKSLSDEVYYINVGEEKKTIEGDNIPIPISFVVYANGDEVI